MYEMIFLLKMYWVRLMISRPVARGGARGALAPPQTAEVHFFVKKWGPGRPPCTPLQTAEVHFFSDRTPPP